MYEIQQVTPIERQKTIRTKPDKYPFANLEVGEGFDVPNIELNPPWNLLLKASTLKNMRSNCNYRNRSTGKRFAAAYKDDTKHYIQVWRES